MAAPISFRVKRSRPGAASAFGRRVAAAERRAALVATDRASKLAQTRVRMKMGAVGLGRLGNAVGQTSALKKGNAGAGRTGAAWGVIFARGGDDSLAGGALQAYSRGTVITAKNVEWLAFQTNAIPRRVGRFRMTPARYRSSGFATSIGELVFKRIAPNRAILVIRNVSLSPKNGRARKLGPRPTRTRIPVKEVVAFVLIKQTKRAKRFDHVDIVRLASTFMPRYIEETMTDVLSRGP